MSKHAVNRASSAARCADMSCQSPHTYLRASEKKMSDKKKSKLGEMRRHGGTCEALD